MLHFFVADMRVPSGYSQIRLDRILAKELGLPSSLIWRLCNKKQIRLVLADGAKPSPADQIFPGFRVSEGDDIILPQDIVANALTGEGEPKLDDNQRKECDKWIDILQDRVLYTNEDMIVLDKPVGLCSQPGSKHRVSLDTILPCMLIPATLYRLYCLDLRFGGHHVPKLVHRLDKDVSGIIVLARSPKSAHWLSLAFREQNNVQKMVPRLHYSRVILLM